MELVIRSKGDMKGEIETILTDLFERYPNAKLLSHECYFDGETIVCNI